MLILETGYVESGPCLDNSSHSIDTHSNQSLLDRLITRIINTQNKDNLKVTFTFDGMERSIVKLVLLTLISRSLSKYCIGTSQLDISFGYHKDGWRTNCLVEYSDNVGSFVSQGSSSSIFEAFLVAFYKIENKLWSRDLHFGDGYPLISQQDYSL